MRILIRTRADATVTAFLLDADRQKMDVCVWWKQRMEGLEDGCLHEMDIDSVNEDLLVGSRRSTRTRPAQSGLL